MLVRGEVMSLLIDIPKAAEDALRTEWGNLEQAAKEALLIESYRAGKLSVGLLAETLGIGVIEADRWLAERGVALNYTANDLEADRQSLRELFSAHRS
jgi:predicted HTH domain antitoxin